MTTTKQLASKYRVPTSATTEDLNCMIGYTAIEYCNCTLVAGYYYRGENEQYFAAIYENGELRDMTEAKFADAGHAIEWAIKHV